MPSGEDTGIVRKQFAITAAALLVTACTAGSPSPTPTPSPAQQDTRLFWVADTGTDLRLFREDAIIARTDSPGVTALRYLVSHAPTDPDYVSLWPEDTVINDVVITDAEAVVDLAAPRLNVGAAGEAMAIQQLLWTLLAAEPAVQSMRITVDGAAVESLAGHVDVTQAFHRPPAYEVVAQVWLLEPQQGRRITGSNITLSGMACTFEANVVWAIRRDDTVVKSGSTTADKGACPTWSPWSVVVNGLSPGTYTAEAAEYSAKDGSLVVKDTKVFTIE